MAKAHRDFQLVVGSPGVPSWVPPPGFVKRITMTNTISDVSPNSDPWNPFLPDTTAPWNGVMGVRGIVVETSHAWAPDIGLHGAWVGCGGGHNDGGNNEPYVSELSETPFFERYALPYEGANGFRDYAIANDALGVQRRYCGQPGWDGTGVWVPDLARAASFGFDNAWQDWNGFSPNCMHCYAVQHVLSAAVLGAGYPKGGFIRLHSGAPFTQTGNYSGGGHGTHIFNLNSRQWERFSTTPGPGGGPRSWSWIDYPRNRINAILQSSTTNTFNIHSLGISSRTWSTTVAASSVSAGEHASACTHDDGDFGVVGVTNGSAQVVMRAHRNDPLNGPWVTLNFSGIAPVAPAASSRGLGLTYCPVDRDIYAFRENRIWRFKKPPAATTQQEYLDGAWEWEELFPPMTSDSHPIGWDLGYSLIYNSVRWVESLKSFVCIRWNTLTSHPTWQSQGLCLYRPETAF